MKTESPDKNPNIKGVHERYARLGVIAQILKTPETRERYDFFLKNGVPKWRGTGYYYSRYRPGLGSVLTFLIFLTSGLQYLVQKINYTRDLVRIGQIVTSARTAAWGPKLIPINGTRKVKVPLGGGTYDGDGEYIPGKTLELVVDENSVYLVDPNGSLVTLNESTATRPKWASTWFISSMRHVLDKIWDKTPQNSEETPEVDVENDNVSEESGDSISVSKASSSGQRPSNGTVVAGKRRNRPKKRT